MFRAKLKTDKTVQAAVSGSGDIVSFESAFEKPLADLALNITPVQSGEGDPSPTNIRPISGWTGANVYLSPTEDNADATVYPVTWSDTAGTVYGGTLDVVRGKLTRTHTLRLMTGENDGSTAQMFSTKSAASADISEYATGNLTTFSDYGRSAGAFTARYVPNEALDRYGFACSVAPSRIGDESDVLLARLYIGTNGGTQLRMRFPFEWGIDTIGKANQWLADLNATGTPCQYWVKLRTNYEYDLDPVTINTLLGQNNVWADCGGVENLKLDAVSGKLKFKLIQ